MEKRNNPTVFLQLILALFLLGSVVWESADILKLLIFRNVYDGVNPWALLFLHPYQSELVNYILSIFCLGFAGLAAYFFSWNSGIFAEIADGTKRSFVRLFSAIFLLALANTALKSNFGPEAMYRLTFMAIPLFCSLDHRLLTKAVPAVVIFILAFLCLEPARVVLGPVRLMNEYANFYGETILNGEYVSNKDFEEYRSKGIPVEGEEDFLKKNMLEIYHQALTRGPINHIGHILNPINEYVAGRPLREIYMQYGVGNTMLIKWTMDLLGGPSIQNYYKCYIYYIAYYILFLLMLIYLFRDAGYVLGGMCALAASQFSYGYMGFIMAPGMFPTIHFCDVFVVVFLAAYLRRPGKPGLLALAFMAAASGALLNRQFGVILAAALVITAMFYFFENRAGRDKYTLSGAALASFSLIVMSSFFLASKASPGVTGMFLSGFLSWNPGPLIVFFTLIYITGSYIFFASLKDSRTHLKYLYLFVFFYTQGLFVYFYWSGLINHLPIVGPFIALQLFLALFLLESEPQARPGVLSPGFFMFKRAAVIIMLVCVPFSAIRFYLGYFGGRTYAENFTVHWNYDWDFGRASLVSTIDPRPLKEGLSLVARYSSESEKGIYLLSKYDNLIPFLSGKYNRLPFFEMTWYLIREKTGLQVAAQLEREKPEYIFADSDITDEKLDRWTRAYGEDPIIKKENDSRLGRLKELKKIFRAVSPYYILVEKGPLLSVYRLAEK